MGENNRREVATGTIGIAEGIDLVGRIVEGEGMYGSLKGTGLPEVGPLSDQGKTVELLTKVAVLFREHECNPAKTTNSPAYEKLLCEYGLGNHTQYKG
jgi:hypothetical protein